MMDFSFTNYIAAALRNSGFTNQDDVQEKTHQIVIGMLVAPGGLFANYDETKHGPLEARFKRSVSNAIMNITQKERNRQRYLPTIPIHTVSVPGEPTGDERVIAGFRSLVGERLGPLGLAVLDTRLAGEPTKSLVGASELGSPSGHLVKRIVRRIKSLAGDYQPVAVAARQGEF